MSYDFANWSDYESANLPLELVEEIDARTAASTVGSGSLYSVQGDVTRPERAPDDNSTHALILQTVDDGGELRANKTWDIYFD